MELQWTAHELMHIKHWAQSRTHSKSPVNVGYYDDHCHHFPCSYGQGHVASTSGYDGTVSFLLRIGPKYRVWPLLSLCHFAGPGVSDAPEEKGGRWRSPQGQDIKLEPINWHFKSPVVFLRKGKQGSCVRTHTRKGLRDNWGPDSSRKWKGWRISFHPVFTYCPS